MVTYAFQLVLLHFLSPVTGVHVKVLSSAAVPLDLSFAFIWKRLLSGNRRIKSDTPLVLPRHASNVVELSSWILLIVKRPYAVSEKEQGNLLNEEIKLNHN